MADSESSAPPRTPEDTTGGLIQSPEISSRGKPSRKAVKDAAMGREIIKTLIAANRNRQIVNSRIMAKYNAERPYDQGRLEQEGLGWKQNFTTKPLPQMIEKVAPRFVEALSSVKYLTNASLSSEHAGASEKSEAFRAGITKVIRGRKGWRTLVEDVAMENALFGHTVLSWLDEFTWFPKHFKQDSTFLTDGTKQLVESAQVVALRQVYFPHELFEEIEDRDAADEVGWDIGKTIDAINKASPAQLRDTLTTGGSTDSWYQNAQRELTLGASYTAGASVIVVYNLFAQEVDGKVSHYRFAGDEMAAVFSKDDRFDSASDCLSFFAFQKGNGTMHGSKGIGREVYELAGMIDRTRNEVVDRMILSGKTMVQGPIKNLHKFKMSVIGSMCIIPEGWTVLTQRIDGDVEPFLQLDAYFGQLVNQLIGSVSLPSQLLEGERKSEGLVNLFAAREEEGRDSRVSRFIEFFVDAIGTMQRRICNSDVVDADAKAFQKQMLKMMTREELNEIAKQPVAGTVHDLTPQQRQLIVQLASEKNGNPLYNQRQLQIEDLTSRISADFATKVLLPDQDPTVKTEQTRQQQIELILLSSGQPVPVSPRDNHEIHMEVLLPVAQQVAQAMMQGQAETSSLEVVLAHLGEHYAAALAQGSDKEKLKPVKLLLGQAGPALQKLKTMDQHAADLAEAGRLHDEEMAGGSPPPQ